MPLFSAFLLLVKAINASINLFRFCKHQQLTKTKQKLLTLLWKKRLCYVNVESKLKWCLRPILLNSLYLWQVYWKGPKMLINFAKKEHLRVSCPEIVAKCFSNSSIFKCFKLSSRLSRFSTARGFSLWSKLSNFCGRVLRN